MWKVHGCSSSRVHRLFQYSFHSNFPTSIPARLTWDCPPEQKYIHTNKQTNKHRKRQTAVWLRPYVFNIGQKRLRRRLVSIQSSVKLHETFGQITQKRCTTQNWGLKKLFMYQCFMSFHFLGFFHWKVSNLLFYGVTVKTIYRKRCVTNRERRFMTGESDANLFENSDLHTAYRLWSNHDGRNQGRRIISAHSEISCKFCTVHSSRVFQQFLPHLSYFWYLVLLLRSI